MITPTLTDCGYTQLTLGAYRITVLPVGEFALDGGAMYGVVPKVLWEKIHPPDDQNRVPLALNCLLIETGDEKILLDTGCGTKFSPKHVAMYGIVGDCNIVHNLKALGLKPEDITQVWFTHLHFDHSGGATCYNDHGELAPTFPNATYKIHQGEWADAHAPSPKSKASYLMENFDPLREAGQLDLFDGPETELLPGLWLKTSGGHTAHHQLLVLDLPEGGLIYWGDICPTHHYIKIPYVMAYDLYPLDTMTVKQRWLMTAHDRGWYNVFEHDLNVPCCQVTLDTEKGVFTPIIPNLSKQPA